MVTIIVAQTLYCTKDYAQELFSTKPLKFWSIIQGVPTTTAFFQTHTSPTILIRFQKFLH